MLAYDFENGKTMRKTQKSPFSDVKSVVRIKFGKRENLGKKKLEKSRLEI